MELTTQRKKHGEQIDLYNRAQLTIGFDNLMSKQRTVQRCEHIQVQRQQHPDWRHQRRGVQEVRRAGKVRRRRIWASSG